METVTKQQEHAHVMVFMFYQLVSSKIFLVLMLVLEMVSVQPQLELANVNILTKHLIVLLQIVILPIVLDTELVTLQLENVTVSHLMLVHLALFQTPHVQCLQRSWFM